MTPNQGKNDAPQHGPSGGPSNNLHGKLIYARSYLADLYEDARERQEANPSQPGALTTQMAISDAIDKLDTAIGSSR